MSSKVVEVVDKIWKPLGHRGLMDPSPFMIPGKGLVLLNQGILEWQNRARGQRHMAIWFQF